jgi:hypothetical protein
MAEKYTAADAENHGFAYFHSFIPEQSRSNAAFTMRGMMMNKKLSACCSFCAHGLIVTL